MNACIATANFASLLVLGALGRADFGGVDLPQGLRALPPGTREKYVQYSTYSTEC